MTQAVSPRAQAVAPRARRTRFPHASPLAVLPAPTRRRLRRLMEQDAQQSACSPPTPLIHVNKDALARRRVFSGHASMTSSDEPPAYFIVLRSCVYSSVSSHPFLEVQSVNWSKSSAGAMCVRRSSIKGADTRQIRDRQTTTCLSWTPGTHEAAQWRPGALAAPAPACRTPVCQRGIASQSDCRFSSTARYTTTVHKRMITSPTTTSTPC